MVIVISKEKREKKSRQRGKNCDVLVSFSIFYKKIELKPRNFAFFVILHGDLDVDVFTTSTVFFFKLKLVVTNVKIVCVNEFFSFNTAPRFHLLISKSCALRLDKLIHYLSNCIVVTIMRLNHLVRKPFILFPVQNRSGLLRVSAKDFAVAQAL